MSSRDSSAVRRYLSRVFLALCVIAAGIGYLGNVIPFCPWTHFTLFFPGWGALFLIIPAVCGLIRHPYSWFWPICLLIGVLIILSNAGPYPTKVWVAVGLAALLILIGIRILLEPIFRRIRRRRVGEAVREAINGAVSCDGVSTVFASTGADGENDCTVTFGERTIVADGEFTSATLSCSFGELTLDLRQAVVRDCAVIDAQNSFGETNILLPDDVRVELHHQASFGQVNNRHTSPSDPAAPTIYINANTSFGEINIK